MQRNYPQMFSPADDQDKYGFRCRDALKIGCSYILVQPFVLESLLIFLQISNLEIN